MSKLASTGKNNDGKARKRHDARKQRAQASIDKVGKGDGTERNSGGYTLPGSMNMKKTGRS